AIILASLDGELAAQVLELLPAERARDVMLRIARLDEVDSQALEELDRVLEKQLGKKQKAPPKSVDGMTSAAAILNHMGSALEAEILESIIEADGELGEKIHDLMFVFEDLLEVDDRGMQRLLRDVAGDSLVVALKGVDDQLKDKFFRNMSSRAAEMLMEDLEAAGPVKLSEVETAQKDILAVATKLSEEGEIFLGKGDGEYV
ncbi:MAG: flagellar motor switch protein FliG, partial [Halieaceae bacterium]